LKNVPALFRRGTPPQLKFEQTERTIISMPFSLYPPYFLAPLWRGSSPRCVLDSISSRYNFKLLQVIPTKPFFLPIHKDFCSDLFDPNCLSPRLSTGYDISPATDYPMPPPLRLAFMGKPEGRFINFATPPDFPTIHASFSRFLPDVKVPLLQRLSPEHRSAGVPSSG